MNKDHVPVFKQTKAETTQENQKPEGKESKQNSGTNNATIKSDTRNNKRTIRLQSQLPRRPTDVTIITQCSISRLDRLECMCATWAGVVSAALIDDESRTDSNADSIGTWLKCRHLPRLLRAARNIHGRVESWGRCRLDLSLCRLCAGPAARDGLYPMNALRNAARDEARTDLVFLLDVDVIPSPGLHERMSSPAMYSWLLKTCCPRACSGTGVSPDPSPGPAPALGAPLTSPPCFLVIPALEVTGATSPDDPRILSLLRLGAMRKDTGAALWRDAAADASAGISRGWLQGFHAQHYPAGHGPTDLGRWCYLAQRRDHTGTCRHQDPEFCPRGCPPWDPGQGDGQAGTVAEDGVGVGPLKGPGVVPWGPWVCSEAEPYEVSYAPGYEPYGVFGRVGAPRLDDRFRGFGHDRTSFCLHLHHLGWRFRVLPGAYLVDLPHPPSGGRLEFEVEGEWGGLRAATDGLLTLFLRSLELSLAPSWFREGGGSEAVGGGLVAAEVGAGVKLLGRQHEVLAGMSLLAWGDAWVSPRPGSVGGQRIREGTKPNPDPKCLRRGGGWATKGGAKAWSGLVQVSPDGRAGEESDGRPSCMVGRWVTVQVGRAAVGGTVRGEFEGGVGTQIPSGLGLGTDGLCVRSVIKEGIARGVLRYWVRFHEGFEKGDGGKLPGLGLGGGVQFSVRWLSKGKGRCILRSSNGPLGRAQVQTFVDRRFPLEGGRATFVQVEVDLRRSLRNSIGAMAFFRAWVDNSIVFEARAYPQCLPELQGQGECLGPGPGPGPGPGQGRMGLEGLGVREVLLHLFRSRGEPSLLPGIDAVATGDREGFSRDEAWAQHLVDIGGIELWGAGEGKGAEERGQGELGVIMSSQRVMEGQGEREVGDRRAGVLGEWREENTEEDSDEATKEMWAIFIVSPEMHATCFLSDLLRTASCVSNKNKGSMEPVAEIAEMSTDNLHQQTVLERLVRYLGSSLWEGRD
ncbi:unnamed protein product, partial [Discosporangium mesarthrocarpum]